MKYMGRRELGRWQTDECDAHRGRLHQSEAHGSSSERNIHEQRAETHLIIEIDMKCISLPLWRSVL